MSQVDLARCKTVEIAGVSTRIGSREHLILSKLVWARDAQSELQLRDARELLDGTADWSYLNEWAPKLGVQNLLGEISK